ncbi:hypothetical protein [Mycolicibacterium rhodesiae]|uniref:Uncharacterized protein n=1 Tax=Mycolicibacterium rhodesiae TaxID=36814 RepID=A0A1X0IQ87_MYCRH|nr:hypothetical protein [Mycolicibacterium rhodesiae]MCV7344255.1 hypothetical protein [Mycolicibacterium rhodesiae]ORB50125.1 hypothetical protein BST42_20460 [Mycolicibacterium rhodesiae]
MPIRRLCAALGALIALAALVGCAPGGVPDRRADADALAAQVRGLPGVVAATSDFARSQAQGMVYFRLYVDVSDHLTSDQAAAITSQYLRDLAGGTYTGYRLEMDLRRGWNLFAVDSGTLPITNADQIVAQARDWALLRHEFPGATVTMRSTITHPGGQLTAQEGGQSNLARLDLADPSDYTNVSAAMHTLSDRFPHLAGLDWSVEAGKEHPAEIKTSRRLPTTAELDVFNRLNSDQAIAHIDRLRINAPLAAPVWFSEKTIGSHDIAVALSLARTHLPIVATLPAPVLYSAGDQLSGHIGGRGFARGPVVVTVGGCTRYDPLVYLPTQAERQLTARYEICAS